MACHAGAVLYSDAFFSRATSACAQEHALRMLSAMALWRFMAQHFIAGGGAARANVLRGGAARK